ncbi:LPS export ABC transporter periplasmic protein LptC [Candidatus Synechococcus calcipolaris G9]|uniref:LPS export ABC transporter periplasmic protein LptC n=1 Tax=Candidatus Synechococcus calcipolaris G9 TaxID=1497997 RepID=A0ABT6EX01_9SYNE|nr:LPS export ABC transporter periplasmic protein LptC [Candidatus Synechococcus calcipolaris]MDG2990324.1 LPS export ABC transporter periplasmic protein LptC [Candidatus Synechococcus calcipolaris G9]
MRWGLLVLATLTLGGCGWFDFSIAPEPEPEPEIVGGLSFKNLTLRQTNDQGELLWQLKAAEAEYKDDRRIVEVKNLTGELLDQGEPVYKVEAKDVQVQQQGDRLVLKGKTTVTDLRDKGTLVADQFTWEGEKDLLRAQDNLNVAYPEAEVTAEELQADGRKDELRATGKVRVISEEEAVEDLRLTTESLVWQRSQEVLVAGGEGGGVLVERLNGDQVGDRASGEELRWNLETNRLLFLGDVQVRLQEPDLMANAEELEWRIDDQELVSDRPVRLNYIAQGIQAQGQRGVMLIGENRAILEGRVQVNSEAHQAQLQAQSVTWRIPQGEVIGQGSVQINRLGAILRSQQLTWRIAQQEIVASGNVFYRQGNPFVQIRGNQATGWLEEQRVVVTGRVETQILPPRPN